MIKEKGKRGGDVKKAPPGYYTAKQAQQRLGMTASLFRYYVRKGKIKRHVPPLRTEGFYRVDEIDKLATEMALFVHTEIEDVSTTETRIAQPNDADGIVEVLHSMGWPTTTPQQRIEWYAVNPYVDFVVLIDGVVKGYIHAAPFRPDALSDIMSGKRRSWHMTPQDFLPYEAGKSYDLYIGIATQKDVEHHTHRLGFRLISGFMTVLEDLAGQGITIRHLYAVSAELDGQRLCRNLGFIQQPAQGGDLFPRFVLDLETSDSHFARLYREAVHTLRQIS